MESAEFVAWPPVIGDLVWLLLHAAGSNGHPAPVLVRILSCTIEPGHGSKYAYRVGMLATPFTEWRKVGLQWLEPYFAPPVHDRPALEKWLVR